MTKSPQTIPVIDLFAGPGGLSEGFSRYADWYDADVRFRSVLSIEKEATAARTLTLRTFYRLFASAPLPAEYWSVIRGESQPESLERFPQWRDAQEHVWQAELGKINLTELHTRISTRLAGADDWLLLGGPPCQAYSLVGRARMTGIGHEARKDEVLAELTRVNRLAHFRKDVRHVLYREYLRIIAVHQPAVFVMENVKGILSARAPDSSGGHALIFDRIREDLRDPWEALADDADLPELTRLSRPGRPKYRLVAFGGAGGDLLGEEPDNSDFLIQSENHGLPQKRHRVIVLGIREDREGAPGALMPSERATVREAIGRLPPLRSGLSRGDSESAWRASRTEAFAGDLGTSIAQAVRAAIETALEAPTPRLGRGHQFVPATKDVRQNSVLEAWLTNPELSGFIQHETRGHMPSDLGRYLFAAATALVTKRSPKLEEWPSYLLPAHRNVSVSDTSGEVEAAGFSDRFKVQVWDDASSTITSHIAKDGHYFIHPDPAQGRSLTVREAARLQTFPDDYYFCGNRTEQYQQVGNAVPPYLAVQLARAVAPLFETAGRESQQRTDEPEEALLRHG